jgi:hypothetical protein
MRPKLYSLLLNFVALLFISEIALAHGDHQTDFSGYEIFLGIPVDDITEGATFACWTHVASDQWLSPADSNGGLCGARIDYQGTAGIGNSVNIIGGTWLWQQPHGKIHSGRVLDGQVVWPDILGRDIGCGPGIGVITANISLRGNPADAGDIVGCLDDTHGLIPPRVWGDLILAEP